MVAGSAVCEVRRTSPLMPWAAPILPIRMRLAGVVMCCCSSPGRSLAGRAGRGKGAGRLALADQFDDVQQGFEMRLGQFEAIKRRHARDLVEAPNLVALLLGPVG